MVCSKCQSYNEAGNAFCLNCGNALTDTGNTPTLVSYPSGNQAVATGGAALVGQVLDERYRLETILGRGGMGTVYLATRLKLGDTVAVKVLHPERLTDHQAVARFRREAHAAAALKHPNAVAVYDFGVTPAGLCYIVMELVQGTNLRQLLAQTGSLPAKAAADILAQACAALDEAHRQGVIHRDLKPDNIIVHDSAAGRQVKVLDFGIAKIADDTGQHSLTATGNVMGTPHYMSPEQCLGQELDARSDVYSLGIVLYEMLTGSVPFKSPTATALAMQHVQQPPASPRAFNASIPPAVEAVVLRALAKRREDRPMSAGALARELSTAVSAGYNTPSNYPVLQPGYGTGEAVTATGAVHVAPPPTMVINSPLSGQQPMPTPPGYPAPTPAASPKLWPYALAALLLAVIGGSALWLWTTRGGDGPWPDHLGLFARQGGSLTELPRKDFTSLMKARDELTQADNLPVTAGQPTLILYAQDVPATDLKLFQLDTLDKSGQARYWPFQVAPATGQPDMKQLKVSGGLPAGRYAFALTNGFADEGTHKLWPFQVTEGVTPNEQAQTITLSIKPKAPSGPGPLPPTVSGPAPPPQPLVEVSLPAVGGTAYCRSNNVVLRAAPNLNGPKVDKLYSGQPLAVLAHSSNADIWRGQRARWVLVTTPSGSQGWVFGALVR